MCATGEYRHRLARPLPRRLERVSRGDAVTPARPVAGAAAPRLCRRRLPDGRGLRQTRGSTGSSRERRGILPLDAFHVPRSLRKAMRRGGFEIRVDTAFEAVIRGLRRAGAEPGRETWLNERADRALCRAAPARAAPTASRCWRDGELVGGLYGVALGGAFFGESMFSRVPRRQQDRPGRIWSSACAPAASCCSTPSS